MYNSQQKIFIRRFRWLYNDHVTGEMGYEQQMLQLRDMAKEAVEWVPQEYRELFLHFAMGGNIKPGDSIKSAQYLGSLFSCTNSFDRLIILYPTIYDVDFTFCVPDGWLEILDSLSSAIDITLAQYPKFSIEVSDVKEKFNSLRFYYSLSGPEEGFHDLDQQIEALITQAEDHIQNMALFERGK